MSRGALVVLEAMMAAHKDDADAGDFPGETLRTATILHCEERSGRYRVLLLPVDLQRAVKRSRTKRVALDRVGGIEVASRVDHERLAAQGQLKGEGVVMCMAPLPAQTNVAATHEHVERTRADNPVATLVVRGLW